MWSAAAVYNHGLQRRDSRYANRRGLGNRLFGDLELVALQRLTVKYVKALSRSLDGESCATIRLGHSTL